ncbi:MAG: prepilin-type N-terminal cleavage/methylation domain-containing protein [Proteobacteria bacterium]|nr:prepilin-type N-terminal cleavage/methylation domain-containing protein [Burkholderiales bacterium]
MMAMRQQRGFTLIEIAIVLVIVGLLLGGVLKGQELITSARVRNLISTQDGVKAAFFGFQDRFRAVPGDYQQAAQNIANMATTGCGAGNGNGNGTIDPGTESVLTWEHLSKAGFITGTFVCNAAQGVDTTPTNPYNVWLQLIFDGVYVDAAGAAPQRHNLKTGAQIPVEIIAEVDRKVDDGRPYTGSFRFSVYQGNAAVVPSAGAAVAPNCATDALANQWNSVNGSPNCGGAIVF